MDTRTNTQRFRDQADAHERRLKVERSQHIFRTKYDLAAHLTEPHAVKVVVDGKTVERIERHVLPLYEYCKWTSEELILAHLDLHPELVRRLA